jgi:hypothetical protein
MSGSYSNPTLREKVRPLAPFDFGGGASATLKVAIPLGCNRAFLHEVGVENITEAFADDTVTAKVQVGFTGDADAYASLVVADGTATTVVFRAGSDLTGDDTDAITEPEMDLADHTDDLVLLTFVNGTDSGTVAGIGTPYAIISFW